MAGQATTKPQRDAGNRRTTRRPRRTPGEIRERLLVAAREEFNRCGFAGARTAAIARRAEVTEAQLFRYYDSKTALFEDAVFEHLNQHFSEFNARNPVGDAATTDHRELERLYIREFQQFLGEHAGSLLSLVVAGTHTDDDVSGIAAIDSLRSYFERGATMMAERVGDDARVDPALMVRVSFAAVLGCVIFKDWLFHELPVSANAVDDAIMEFVLDGINANRAAGAATEAGAIQRSDDV